MFYYVGSNPVNNNVANQKARKYKNMNFKQVSIPQKDNVHLNVWRKNRSNFAYVVKNILKILPKDSKA